MGWESLTEILQQTQKPRSGSDSWILNLQLVGSKALLQSNDLSGSMDLCLGDDKFNNDI